MFSQIVKSVPDPCKLPDFMKQKGGQSRPLAITDFVKPVRSANEKSLNHELYLLHTKKKRTDRLGFCRDFKLRVVTIWRQTQTLCNTYLKCEEHLQLHEKEIVSQASHAEVVHTTSVTGGLPAEQPSFCQPPLQLQPPRDDPATRKGHGEGGADSIRQRARCKQNASVNVAMAGHDCVLYLISIGRDPRQYSHTEEMAAKMGMKA